MRHIVAGAGGGEPELSEDRGEVRLPLDGSETVIGHHDRQRIRTGTGQETTECFIHEAVHAPEGVGHRGSLYLRVERVLGEQIRTERMLEPIRCEEYAHGHVP